jgi:hypothetical protein
VIPINHSSGIEKRDNIWLSVKLFLFNYPSSIVLNPLLLPLNSSTFKHTDFNLKLSEILWSRAVRVGHIGIRRLLCTGSLLGKLWHLRHLWPLPKHHCLLSRSWVDVLYILHVLPHLGLLLLLLLLLSE